MGKALWTTAWSRKNPLGERDVILTHDAREDARRSSSRYYVPEQHGAHRHRRRDAGLASSRWRRRIFGDWPRGDDPFVDRSDSADAAAHARTTAVIVEQPVNTVAVMLQWQGPSAAEDPDVDVRGRRVLRRAQSAGLARSSAGSWTVGCGSRSVVNYYTLNHVGPITISGETSPDKLREALAALDEEIAKFDEPGYFTTAERWTA